ncbi:24243_t:CDS:2, partial [Gigaspora margarita]
LEPNDVVFKCQKLLHEKDENVREICKMPCPSTSAFPRRWKECNENPLKIYNLRPPECSGPPVSLFHPVFIQFLADYHNYELDVLAERYIQVLEFCHIIGQIYKNEVFREKAVPILWEYKNEIGTGGKDPSIKEGVVLQNIGLNYRCTVKIHNNSCCPSIILAIAGPWVCVLGAVYLEKPVIEPLTDFILIADRPEDDGKRVKELAVFFESLRLAFRTLDNYYKNLKELDEAENEKIQRFFSYHNQYQIDENEIKFTYLYKLTEEPRDLTWKVETDRGKIVIAKFTKSNDHLLRGKNILYADDESFKGWRMVISEFET